MTDYVAIPKDVRDLRGCQWFSFQETCGICVHPEYCPRYGNRRPAMTAREQMEPRRDGPNVALLRSWAQTRNLRVDVSPGGQREPEGYVTLKREGSAPGHSSADLVMQTSSRDSVETAALYMLSKLRLLGIEL